MAEAATGFGDTGAAEGGVAELASAAASGEASKLQAVAVGEMPAARVAMSERARVRVRHPMATAAAPGGAAAGATSERRAVAHGEMPAARVAMCERARVFVSGTQGRQ